MPARHKEKERPPRPPHCVWSPLLWSLLPLIGGILACRQGTAAFGAGLLLLLATFTRRVRVPRTIVLLSYIAGGLLIRQSMDPPHSLWEILPPRETTVELEVVELFNARKPDRVSGIGRILRHDIPYDTVSGRRAAFYLETSLPHSRGSRLECRALLTYLPAIDEPDGFQLYLKSRDIFLNLNRGTVLRQTSPAGPAERYRERLFRKSQSLLSTGCEAPEDPGNVLASMLLGKRSLLTDDRIDLYRHTGTYHLFAVSGLHVGSVALCLHWIGGLLRLPRAVRLLAVLSATWGYVWLTGSSPSAMRAGIMISCLGMARHLSRQPHLFPALVVSAWIVLLWQPSQLFSLGFQLSYAVVGAIILMGLPVARYFRLLQKVERTTRGPTPPVKRALVLSAGSATDLACVSLAAGLASMPLIIQHFNLFTPVGILLGILLNPLATFCVMAGSITLLCGLPAGPAAGSMILVAWPAVQLMEGLLQFSIGIPGAFTTRTWPWPPFGTIFLALVLGLAWLLQYLRHQGRDLGPASLFLPHALILTSLFFPEVQT